MRRSSEIVQLDASVQWSRATWSMGDSDLEQSSGKVK